MPVLDIPQDWAQIDLNGLKGVVLVVGLPDIGKSTFSRYLFNRLCAAGQAVAYIDGDPGQSLLGPPTTQTAYLPDHPQYGLPAVEQVLSLNTGLSGRIWRWFTGSTTARGHMLNTLVGASRLVQAVVEAGADVVVFDTCGYVARAGGGLHLKLAMLDLLRPAMLVVLRREGELGPLLDIVKHSRRTELVELHPSPAALQRARPVRRDHRARQFARYFKDSTSLWIDWSNRSVVPSPHIRINQLMALENLHGFTDALGIVEEIDPPESAIKMKTPLGTLTGIAALHLGDLLLDPVTFRDQIID